MRTFKGGVHPHDWKELSRAKAIEALALPPQVILPMSQHLGVPCTPTVKKGDAATIKAVKVVKQSETPGLGDKCEKDGKFARQFEGLAESKLKLAKYIPYRDPGTDEQPIAAITGATITSKAVIGAIRDAIERVRKNVPDGTAKP
jgi:Na+-transporting NADH:ubiquinone oxidoreductase subunit NqrC